MLIRIRARIEAMSQSLFFIPSIYLVGALALSEAAVGIDRWIEDRALELPLIFLSTVGSARALLGTVAAATITVAGIAFSVSLLTIQLASTQFSPRVLRGYFRDKLSKHVMGLSVATFAYCLMVLRVVRVADGGAVPHLSVLAAIALGIATILGIVAFINHSAHSMQVGEIVRRVASETRELVQRLCPDEGEEPRQVGLEVPETEGFEVRFGSRGWVQQVNPKALMGVVDPGGVMKLEIAVGDYVTEGMLLATLWPQPDDPEEAIVKLRGGVGLGNTRTMQQDLRFGLRQMVDVALRALSPGVNDPTTAVESIVHLGDVLAELSRRELPQVVYSDDEERRLLLAEEPEYEDYLRVAVQEIAEAGASQVRVILELLRVLGMLLEVVEGADMPERAQAVRRRAEAVVELFERSAQLPEEFERVRHRAKGLGLAT